MLEWLKFWKRNNTEVSEVMKSKEGRILSGLIEQMHFGTEHNLVAKRQPRANFIYHVRFMEHRFSEVSTQWFRFFRARSPKHLSIHWESENKFREFTQEIILLSDAIIAEKPALKSKVKQVLENYLTLQELLRQVYAIGSFHTGVPLDGLQTDRRTFQTKGMEDLPSGDRAAMKLEAEEKKKMFFEDARALEYRQELIRKLIPLFKKALPLMVMNASLCTEIYKEFED